MQRTMVECSIVVISEHCQWNRCSAQWELGTDSEVRAVSYKR